MTKCKIAIVPNDTPNADKQWLDIVLTAPALAIYLQERRELAKDWKPRGWGRTVDLFAEHVPVGHHMVAIKTSGPASGAPPLLITRT